MQPHNATIPRTLFEPWSCCALAPNSIATPAELLTAQVEWLSAEVPGTAASALRDNGRWDAERPLDIESLDWCYRTTFPATSLEQNPSFLCFDGLATHGEVWLNGEQLLTTENMFRSYRVEILKRLQAENELVLFFRSLAENLKQRRPRPRWKTNLVSNQQLRWQRTSLLGHIPGWSPPVPAIGPWRAIRLENSAVSLSDVKLHTTLEGSDGVVHFEARVHSLQDFAAARLHVGERQIACERVNTEEGPLVRGQIRIPNPELWWPCTHGPQPLYDCRVALESLSEEHAFDLGGIGFRQLRIRTEGGFGIEINGEPIYCRGACWTSSDIFTQNGTEESLRHDLHLARDVGMNMLRVGGTMSYESDSFYRLCDELGILVWQDFMFANMDYPVDDPAFASNIEIEARQQLDRLASHPCVAVYCGNSEIEQQAAMLGMPRELWRNAWFGERLPALCEELHPGTAYVPSTPSGGVLPFHTRSGITHYYGIGAYLRAPSELRQADVKFTPECLGFANIPDPESLNDFLKGSLPVVHHPSWKQRVPRDTGAGWDFEDVRDFYLRQLYGLDPVQLRSSDMPRYLKLSRLASGEMMARAFSEWRSGHSQNRGGLVWFFKDLWHGAGWGVVDAGGIPKAAYYYLRRVWQTRQILITDEALDGLHLHVVNETSDPLACHVEVTLLKEPNVVVARHEREIHVSARAQQTLSVDEMLGGFYDVSYAYRFGAANHDVVVATLYDAQRRILSEAFHFVHQRPPSVLAGMILDAEAEQISDTQYLVTLRSDCLLQGVRLSAKGYLPSDNYFHLLPARRKQVVFTALDSPARAFKASIESLSLDEIQFVSPPASPQATHPKPLSPVSS